MIARYRERGLPLWFRGDAAFAKPEIYEMLEREAEGGSGARWWLADRAPAALAAREPPPCGELRPAEGTRCEKTHRQGPDPVPDAAEAGAIRGMSFGISDTHGCDCSLAQSFDGQT